MNAHPNPTTGTDQTEPLLAVDHLDVTLGAARIVQDVSLRVRPGEFVALLGANGSGKSTLVRTTVGAIAPTGGMVRLFGEDVTQRRRVAWQRLGYVPQRSTATAGIPATVTEVVGSGLLGAHRFTRPRGAAARIAHALEQVGLAQRASDAVAHLSGGQQQRVLIARALVRDPDLLVMDEPLAGVDTAQQTAFAETMASLAGGGRGVLVVLHETGPLAPLITRAVVLRHGRVVHDGAPPLPAPGHDHPGHSHQHDHAPQLRPRGSEHSALQAGAGLESSDGQEQR